MQKATRIDNVIFDPARRRFLGQVQIASGPQMRAVTVDAAGHPSWGHRRIVRALTQAAEHAFHQMERHNARA